MQSGSEQKSTVQLGGGQRAEIPEDPEKKRVLFQGSGMETHVPLTQGLLRYMKTLLGRCKITIIKMCD